MNKNKWVTVLAAVVVFVIPLGLFTYWILQERPLVDELPFYGMTLVPGTDSLGQERTDTLHHILPDFSLPAHNGDTLRRSDLEGKVTVATFFHTACGQVCDDLMLSMLYLQREYLEEDKIRLIAVTANPAADSLQALRNYARDKQADARRWMLLTGSEAEINQVRDALYLSDRPSGGLSADALLPGTFLVLIDQQGRIRGYYDGTDREQTDRLRVDIIRLLLAADFPHTRKGGTKRP